LTLAAAAAVAGTGAAAATGVRVDFHNGSLRTDGVIIKQRGAKTFVVQNQAGTKATCVLQAAIPDGNGEMRINGYVGGNGATPTPLAKITKRVATDFSGNRYTWQLVNDSTSDYVALTRITTVS
jgi:hypothetical protein